MQLQSTHAVSCETLSLLNTAILVVELEINGRVIPARAEGG